MRDDYMEPIAVTIDGDGVLTGLTLAVDTPVLATVVLDPTGLAAGWWLQGKGVSGTVHVTASGTNSGGQAVSGTIAVNLTAPPPPSGHNLTVTEGTAVPIPPPPPPSNVLLLEDFSGAAIRTNADGATPLWAAIVSENPNQSAHLNTLVGAFQLDYVSTPPGASGPYLHFFPKSGNSYAFPEGYAQHYLKSSVWDANVNRLGFWVKPSKTIPRRPDGGDVLQIGTYIRPHANTDNNAQGFHYYHGFDQNWYAGRWHYCEINRVPSHQVGQSPYTLWPEDPEAQAPTLTGLTPYAGTVAVTNGSAVVTATGPDLNSLFAVGAYIYFAGDASGSAYKILSVDSPTQLTLGYTLDSGPVQQPYQGATATALGVGRCAVLPTPVTSVGKVPAPEQVPTHYFDGLTRFYFDIAYPDVTPAGVGAYDNTFWLLDDFVFRMVPAEAEALVYSACAVYNGAAYELSWQGPKGQAVSHTVYYATTGSMKAADGSYNGTGTSTPAVSLPADGYRTVLWTSPPTPEADAFWLFVQPAGSLVGYEVKMERRP